MFSPKFVRYGGLHYFPASRWSVQDSRTAQRCSCFYQVLAVEAVNRPVHRPAERVMGHRGVVMCDASGTNAIYSVVHPR